MDSRFVDEVGLLAAAILLFLARRLLVHAVSRQMCLRLIGLIQLASLDSYSEP